MSHADRRSRQELVVPPPASNLPVILGAVACGCLGFALVWAVGLGRASASRGPVPGAMAPPVAIEEPAERPTSDHQPIAVRRASLETPSVETSLDLPPRRLSRFSAPELLPVDAVDEATALVVNSDAYAIGDDAPPASLDRFPPDIQPMADEVGENVAETWADDEASHDPATESVAASRVNLEAVPDAELPAENPSAEATGSEDAFPRDDPATEEVSVAKDMPAEDAENTAENDRLVDTFEPEALVPDDAASEGIRLDHPAAPDAPRAFGTTGSGVPEIVPESPSAAMPRADEDGRDPSAQDPGPMPALLPDRSEEPAAPAELAPLVIDGASHPTAPPPPSASRFNAPARPSPFAAAPPVASPTPSGILPTGVPFAAAPPVMPTFPDAPDLDGPPRGRSSPPQPGSDGQGRPGAIQLEGVQSPQLTVEKRGPREIQVGKPARFEVLVRNVGSAVARDVVLRDAVPYGTALVTTSPPAAPAPPGAPGGELTWMLGELPPGGQARIIIEVMPQSEGEIGSVASVTFRADASVRARATKPAIQLDATEPEAVLIGRDSSLTITVSNPGTGIATGVVLEGFLPENVSHRSGRELEFDVGQLRPGESRTIELVLGTRGPGVHTARLAARADGGLEVERLVKLEVTAPTLELAIDMPLRRFLQRSATCEISMVNAGTATARSIELAAQLPPGMKFVRANNAGWHDARTNRVLWNLEELPPGEVGAVELVVMPVELGTQKILAAARSIDGLADQVTHLCEVEGVAALSFEIADSEDPIEVEGLTEYVVRVVNQGTKAATGVRVTAALLGDLEPVEARGPAGHRVENLTVLFEPLAKLAPAEEAVYRLRARGRSAGDQRVQVQLVSEEHPAPITKEEVTRVYDDR
jgi:uncharacterized repeat protein (TIGR01451 family)